MGNKSVITILEDEIPTAKRQKSMLDFHPPDSTSNKKCTVSITEFIVGAVQPYYIVESELFVNMIKTLNPPYKVPG